MSAAIGISSLSSLISTPSGCVLNEVSKDISKEIKTIKNSSGVTIQAGLVPMTTTKISAKGKGIAPLSSVAATSSITSGTIVVVSVSVDESNTDFPGWSIEANSWS